MCIIKLHRVPSSSTSHNDPIAMPIRPIPRPMSHSQPHPPPHHRVSDPRPPLRSSPRTSKLAPSKASAGSFHRSPRTSQQLVVIATPSPRTSRPTFVERSSYSYGSGPVPMRQSLELGLHLIGETEESRHRRRSYSNQNAGPSKRRSGASVNLVDTGPRHSNVSFRSTATREREERRGEKIVIVDEMGKRRESGFH